MTKPSPASNQIDIVLDHQIKAVKFYDFAKEAAYLSNVLSLWERGKIAAQNGNAVAQDEWSQVVNHTRAFVYEMVNGALTEAVPPVVENCANKVAVAVRDHAFAEGVRHGQLTKQNAGRAAIAQDRGNIPALPAKLAPVLSLDSQAIVKTIGEEMRKMFEAGIEQGKTTAGKASGEAGDVVKLEKPSGEVVRVQRNAAGEIVGAVKEFVYQENRQALPSA